MLLAASGRVLLCAADLGSHGCVEAGWVIYSTSAGAGQGLRYHLTLKAVPRLSASVSAVEILNFIHYMMKVIMGH